MGEKTGNYKQKTITLMLLNAAIISGFVLYPKDIKGNIIILLIAIVLNSYDLKVNYKTLPAFYVLARCIFILLFMVGILFSMVN